MKRFFLDTKKFSQYLVYATKSELKSEVASSRLSWMWWVLDPLLFMMVYTFISLVVFKKGMPYFPVFVFIGLTIWNFFNKTVQTSVKLVKINSAIVSKIYVPKYIFIMKQMLINGFKMCISFLLTFLLMLIYRVPLTWRILYVIPLLATLFVVTFGVSTIMLHVGVFIDDLSNVISVLLRLLFYMSGVFYSIENSVPEPFGMLIQSLNPIACIMQGMRNALLYGKDFQFVAIGGWFIGGILIALIGVNIIYKNENSYVKVM